MSYKLEPWGSWLKNVEGKIQNHKQSHVSAFCFHLFQNITMFICVRLLT